MSRLTASLLTAVKLNFQRLESALIKGLETLIQFFYSSNLVSSPAWTLVVTSLLCQSGRVTQFWLLKK